MAQRTSNDLEEEFLQRLESDTGRPLELWLGLIDTIAVSEQSRVIEWLKIKHGFRHLDAALLAGIHANGGKPVYPKRQPPMPTRPEES